MTPGTLISGRYRVESFLGRGGMGAVYKVIDLHTNRARAIKLMLDHKVADLAARDRFRLEATIAGRIDSPFVVDVLDAGVAPETSTPYIVMELLVGETLDQRLDRLGPRPAAEVVEHLAQVARALQRMRARGVVHRDLKPSNVFLEERAGLPPRIKVLDLGVAKVLSATGADTTAIVGSVPYMAPEQILGRAIGPETDLYALGLIAFTLLTGAPYWSLGPDEETIALAMRIVNGTQAPASERARAAGIELPAGLDAWFARATAREPGARFRSAAEAVRTLADALGVERPPGSEDDPEPAERPDVEAGETADLVADERADPVAETVSSDGAAEIDRGVRSDAEQPAAAPAPASAPAPTPLPRTRPRTRKRTAAIAVAIAVGIALGVRALWPDEPAPPPVPSPLERPGSVLACPILEVSNAKEWGWLGAAAATLACERARVVLGGLPTRTRIPAELLELRDLDAFDADPYGDDTARARSLEVARRSDAYLDGTVTRLGSGTFSTGFRVELALRHGYRTVQWAVGEGAGLHEAVRQATTVLVLSGAIPRAAEADPIVADYSRASDLDTMLHLLDWKLATQNNTGGLDFECGWFADDKATDLASFVRYTCAYMRGYKPPRVVAPAGSTPGALVARARIEHMAHRDDDPVLIAELKERHRTESSTWARSVIASTLSCLLQASSGDEARKWATLAVDEPKNPTGEWCAPWGQLMAVADDTSDEAKASIRWRVWAPWDSYAWRFAARNTSDPELAVRYAKRAYELSPLDTDVATELSNRLLLRRDRHSEVSDIARRLGGSRHPVHQRLSSLLTVRFLTSETRFDKALETARAAMQPGPDDAGWVFAQRLELAWRAVEIAAVLGRASEVAEDAIRALVDPVPPRLDLTSLDAARYVTAICAYASPPAARRCFAKLAAQRSSLNPAFPKGARLLADGNLRAAAKAWRPMIRDARDQVDLLGEAMVRAFSADGERELVVEIEARNHGDAELFGGANLVMARAAQAAWDRGDRAEAVRLATTVVAAWTHADTRLPIVDEMRRLVR